jgi:hypothetical protein
MKLPDDYTINNDTFTQKLEKKLSGNFVLIFILFFYQLHFI